MNRAVLACCVCGIGAVVSGAVAACSSSSNKSTGGNDASTGGDVVTEGAAGSIFATSLPCTDTDDSIYADPGDVSTFAKGAIIKCAKDPDMSAAQMLQIVSNTADAGTIDYQGKPFASGAHVYRILYRTERGDTNNSPGYSSALVFIPDTPRKGPDTPLTLVVATHGSRGQAGKCAPSKDDPAAADVEADFEHLVYPLVGYGGFPVIAPDMAGYANFGGTNNPPSTYDSVTDMGKSNLDGAKALRALIPNGVTSNIAVVGHSQGGYNALATLALSAGYDPGGTIAAVAVYSPIWLSQRAWAAIFLEPATYTLSYGPEAAVSIWYHYTHGELLDGPGHGLDLFQPSKQAIVKSFVENDCWNSSYPDLMDAGTSANDFFLASYIQAIGVAATPLGNGNCQGDMLCQTWIDRMTADWPHLTGSAQTTPILVWYPNNDNTVTPDGMQCVYNRLSSDMATYTNCYDPRPVDHSGPPAIDNNYVVDWVAQKTLGDPAPTEACQPLGLNDAGVPQIVDDAGNPIPCNDLLSNQ